ncbi:MAG: bacillithiol system redox-active protein YtxJ [Bacteroidota bacterium]|jgi:bacillithiol system protein YtxJ
MSAPLRLTDENGLNALIAESHVAPVLIFKHSTRCSISSMALNRMEKAVPYMPFRLVDVIADRPVSNRIAEVFSVHHASPQLLLIHRGACVYEVSHLEIQPREIHAELLALQ